MKKIKFRKIRFRKITDPIEKAEINFCRKSLCMKDLDGHIPEEVLRSKTIMDAYKREKNKKESVG